MIAIALVLDPKVLIMDGSAISLDIIIQSRPRGLIANILRRKRLSVMFIPHGLGVVAEIAGHVVATKKPCDRAGRDRQRAGNPA